MAYVKRPPELRQFYAVLREMGYKRDTTFVYQDLVIYEKEYPDTGVKVDVQLWFDGHHRTSNFHPGSETGNPFGQMDSVPSTFSTVQGMRAAVLFEMTRYHAGTSKDTQVHFG